MRIRRFTRRWAKRSTTFTDWRSMYSCAWRDLGRVDYAEAFEMQRVLVDQRKRGEIPDQLLFVEHPHTITLGRNGHLENLLAGERALESAGVQFHHTNRGGDIP